jgi:hypothetical protein
MKNNAACGGIEMVWRTLNVFGILMQIGGNFRISHTMEANYLLDILHLEKLILTPIRNLKTLTT